MSRIAGLLILLCVPSGALASAAAASNGVAMSCSKECRLSNAKSKARACAFTLEINDTQKQKVVTESGSAKVPANGETVFRPQTTYGRPSFTEVIGLTLACEGD